MTRDHFKQTFNSPYFQSSYYKEETKAGGIEAKIESIFKKFFNRERCITARKLSEGRRITFSHLRYPNHKKGPERPSK